MSAGSMHSVAILLHVAHQVTEIQYPYASTSRASPAAAPGTGLSPRSTIGTYFFKSFFFYHCLLEVKRSSTGEFVRLFLRHTFVRRYVVAQKNSLSLVHSISSAARFVSSERGKKGREGRKRREREKIFSVVMIQAPTLLPDPSR